MIQTIQGIPVYVLDFDAVPQLPVTWDTEEERPYAEALMHAIETGQITQPGKYGIHVNLDRQTYDLFKINE